MKKISPTFASDYHYNLTVPIFEPPKQRLIFKVGDVVHLFSRPNNLYEIVSLETRVNGTHPDDYCEDIAYLRKYHKVVEAKDTKDSSRWLDCIPHFRKLKYKTTVDIPKQPDPLIDKEIILQYYDRINPSYTVFVTRKWYNAKLREYGFGLQ